MFTKLSAQNHTVLPFSTQTLTGVRSVSLSDATTANSLDVNALHVNPAILTYLNDFQLNAELNLQIKWGVLSAENLPNLDKDKSDISYQTVLSKNAINNLSMCIPLKINDVKFVPAISYRCLYNGDFERKFSLVDKEIGNFEIDTFSQRGGISSFVFGAGISSLERFSFGFAFHLLRGNLKTYQNTSLTFSDYIFSQIDSSEAEYSGQYFSFGFYLPFQYLSLGMQVSAPYELSINETFNSKNIEYQRLVPALYRFGACLIPAREFKFSIDYHYSPSAKTEENHRLAPPYFVEKENYSSINLGMELNIFYSKQIYSYRIGYATQNLPFRDIDNQLFLKHWFSLGFGVETKNLIWNLGMLFETSEQTIFSTPSWKEKITEWNGKILFQTEFLIRFSLQKEKNIEEETPILTY